MKKLYIVANWKSNKTVSEATEWIERFKIQESRIKNKEIVVCPSFTSLPVLKSLIMNHKSNIKLGAQDISPFDEGAYTGEISGKQIKEFADYCLVGHSERRKNFGEDEEIILQKIDQAIKSNIVPILCISDTNQIQNTKYKILITKMIIAYEPLFAIGTGSPDTPENADKVASEIKKITDVPILYGGSVIEGNVQSFTKMPNIDGVLVGGASLDAQQFVSIFKNA